jgi:hypothetical protein
MACSIINNLMLMIIHNFNFCSKINLNKLFIYLEIKLQVGNVQEFVGKFDKKLMAEYKNKKIINHT